MLSGYISSLEAYHKRSVEGTANEGQLRPSSDKWTEAIGSAQRALEKFREADTKRRAQLIDEANAFVEQAMELLKSW